MKIGVLALQGAFIEHINILQQLGVEVLARLPNGIAVAARQGKLLVTAFHPEFSDDLRFHRYFLEFIILH